MIINSFLNSRLIQIEKEINEFEKNNGIELDLTKDGFRAVVSLFTMALVDKLQNLQKKENLSFEDALNMATSLGGRINKIISNYTNINTKET